MPTVYRSAFTVATFYGMLEIHECLDCLQLALLPVNEKLLGYKSPYDLLVLYPLIWWYVSIVPSRSETYVLTCLPTTPNQPSL